jgi:hypothetical protein
MGGGAHDVVVVREHCGRRGGSGHGRAAAVVAGPAHADAVGRGRAERTRERGGGRHEIFWWQRAGCIFGQGTEGYI